jgi:ribosomal protein L19E
MPQLNIYLDERTQTKARQAAKREGCSLSSWARQQLGAAADTGKVWPKGYFDLYASIDDPEFKAPERLSENLDAPREGL